MDDTMIAKNGDSLLPMHAAVTRGPKLTVLGGILHELKECAGNTTAHAIPRVAGAEKRWMRYFWAVIFVLAAVIFVFHLSKLTAFYLSYPITTSTSYKSVPFEFPAVTFCNLLPFSLRKLERKDPGLMKLTALKNSEQHFEERLEELLKDTENDLESMLMNCTYNLMQCGPENFTVVTDPVFRQCFTFTPEHPIMANSPEYGLNLLLFAENTHSHPLPDFSFALHDSWEASGVRLVIHQQNTHAHPETKGVNVPPGVTARFSVNMEEFMLYYIYREGRWRCDDDDRLIEFCVPETPNDTIRYKETAEDCYTDVIQRMIFNKCNCLSDQYEVPSSFCEDKPITKEGSYCEEDDPCYSQIESIIRKNFSELVVSQCTATCEQLSYTVQQSMSAWPSHIAEKQVLKNLRRYHEERKRQGKMTSMDEIAESNDSVIEEFDLLRSNLMRISVYAESMTGDQIVEELAYPLPNFVGEVGGILGLWLGGSMLTFIEPLELIANIFLISRMVKRKRRGNGQQSNAEDEAVAIGISANGDPYCMPSKRQQADGYCPPRKTSDAYCA